VLVLVLEKWGWFGEVLEYCAKSELHPRSGLRCWREPDFAPSSETPDFALSLRLREATSGRPLYKMAALSVNSRGLPGITPTECFTRRVYSGRRIQPAHKTATPRDVPGSRLLTNP
jgi:hypothetical protein